MNLVANMAPQDIPLTPTDGAPAPTGGYQQDADRFMDAATSLPQAIQDGGDEPAAQNVEQGVSASLVAGGAIRSLATLCPVAGWVCPAAGVAVGAVFTIVWIGTHKKTATTLDGGSGPANWNAFWQLNTYGDRHVQDSRGPFVRNGEWLLHYPWAGNWSFVHHRTSASDPCEFGPPPPPITEIRDGIGNVCLVDLPLQSYVRTPEQMYNALHPTGPVDTVPPGATTTPAPPAPSRGDLADGLADVLNDPKYRRFAEWLNYQLGHPGAQDPISGKIIVPNCDGLTWTQCRDEMIGYGFAPPIKLTIDDDQVALSDAEAGKVAIVEGEKTGRDPDDDLGVAVMPDLMPTNKPFPTFDPIVETETTVIIESDSTACDISPGAGGPDPTASSDPFDERPIPHFVVNTTTIPPISVEPPENATMLLTGHVKTNITGFGYQKIYAKHGWTVKDETFTRATLSTPFHVFSRTLTQSGKLLDAYFAQEPSGAWYFHRTPTALYLCARMVVINSRRVNEWNTATGIAVQPMTGLQVSQTGIWTSYGKAISTKSYTG